MKKILLVGLLCFATLGAGATPPIAADYAERVAHAIYRVEGGARAKVPYGILALQPPATVQTRDQLEAWARRICLNTIRNNWRRWHAAGTPGEYLDFLADRYCPPGADPVGNRNWKKNIKAILK